MLMRKIYFFFFFLSFLASVNATTIPSLQYLGIENGLSNNAVTSIFQDSRGFMWFGTFDGLNRYDGYSFKVFRNRLGDSSSLVNNWITAINEDNDGNIWVGTKRGGVIYRIASSSFVPLSFLSATDKKLRKMTNVVNCLERDRNGNFFTGTAGMGLLLKRKDALHPVQVPFKSSHGVLADYHVQAIKGDSAGRLWLFIQGEGLALFDFKSSSVRLVNSEIRTARCIEPDNHGNVWIGGELGLHAYNLREQKITESYRLNKKELSADLVVQMCLSRNGELWVATDGGGVNVLNIASKTFRYIDHASGNLTSSAVYAVFQDKDSRIWIGTLRGGVNILDQKKSGFQTFKHDPLRKNSVSSNFIISFCEERSGNVWIGTDGDGVNYWDREKNTFMNYVHTGSSGSLSNNNVSRIVRDYQGQIWLATYGGGINRVNEGHSFKLYPCYNSSFGYYDWNVWSLFEDSHRDLWAGTCTEGGLYRLNRKTDKFELFSKDLKNIITLAEDRNGNLWGGTFSDLLRIDPGNKKHIIYHIGYAVRAILEDRRRNFWIATEGGGLLNFNPKTGSFQRFSEAEGLTSNSILSVLEDKEGSLWLSTFEGLCKFNPETKKAKNFYESDGLQSNQFNYNAAASLSTGEFLFGGIKGFNVFHPGKIRPYSTFPKVILTGLRINNVPFEKDHSYAPGKTIYDVTDITLPYDKAVLSVDFAALEYSAQEKIRYAYYLEGWDKGWNYCGTARTAYYTRLQEGHYKLRIKSTNTDGIWDKNCPERYINVVILPPWWRSWWAWLLYSILGVTVVYAYIAYQKKQALLKYEIQLVNLKIDQEKELNEKKLSFFTHIAHEFRTPLTLIINPVKEMLYSTGRIIDSQELSVVYRNSRRLLSLVDQLLLFRKADCNEDKLKVVKLNFVDLCKEVFLCFSQQASYRNINYQIICRETQVDLFVDREKVEIVLFNLINNALKYTSDGGRVTLEIVATDKYVKVFVSDNGCGIPEEIGDALFQKFYRVRESNHQTGFGIGLYLVKKFIEAHRGSIGYSGKQGEGTCFELTFLKGKDHFHSSLIFEDVCESSVFLEELIDVNSFSLEASSEKAAPEAAKDIVSERPVMIIVDDNIQIRNYIKSIFQDEYIIYTCGDGEEGHSLITRYQPDIVISDVVMPGVSGIELCARIKEDPALNHIPVILLTASSSSEIKLKGIEGGADDYITKPFEKDLLIARVAGIIRSRKSLQKYFLNEVTLQRNDFQIPSEYSDFLKKCITVIEAHLDDTDFNIKVFSSELGMSHSSLYKKVKSISGRSINEFIRFIRLRKAAEVLINTSCNVNEAAFRAGFSDIKYFREQFFKLFEMKPSEYIKKYRKPLSNNFKLNGKLVK